MNGGVKALRVFMETAPRHDACRREERRGSRRVGPWRESIRIPQEVAGGTLKGDKPGEHGSKWHDGCAVSVVFELQSKNWISCYHRRILPYRAWAWLECVVFVLVAHAHKFSRACTLVNGAMSARLLPFVSLSFLSLVIIVCAFLRQSLFRGSQSINHMGWLMSRD